MIPVPTLHAATFLGELKSGATVPCVFSCENAAGEPVGEYVVKFKSQVRGGPTGLLFESVAAQLALCLGLRVPSPAVVVLDQPLANAAQDLQVADRILKSLGPNYGCQYLVGYSTWPVNEPVPLSLQRTAFEIMAFDALIDNADRRRVRPNLLWKTDEIFILDHELAFSFSRLIGNRPQPFDYESLSFLRDHPLYAGLKGRPIDLSRIIGEIESLERAPLDSFFESAPVEFGRDHKETIIDWLISATQRTNHMADSLGKILS